MSLYKRHKKPTKVITFPELDEWGTPTAKGPTALSAARTSWEQSTRSW